MLRVSSFRMPVEHSEEELLEALQRRLGLPNLKLGQFRIYQRATDARRGKPVFFSYTIDIIDPDARRLLTEAPAKSTGIVITERPKTAYQFIADHRFRPGSKRPIIVGTGPCGLFAALLLAKLGLRPLLLERGKLAGPRARDVTHFWRTGEDFKPDSNVQFGEGGAGTFSDGKLYTQIKDREYRIRWILEQFVAHGAPHDILVNSRPHIGTDRLIKVLRQLREAITEAGGEFRFESRVTELLLEDGRTQGVRLADGTEIEADHVILAVGHSARDVFEMAARQGLAMEAKPFSVGVRIEHPQKAMNRVQYGRYAEHPKLGAAAYKFAYKTRGRRGVYSFCMCPGGLVVGAASEPGRLVTNGMSSYARSDANANSGFMVEVRPEDYGSDGSPLAGVNFQRKLEEQAFRAGGENYHAPAQLLGDFLKNRASKELGDVEPSFRPGVTLGNLRDCLPDFIFKSLQEAAPRIERSLKGFNRPDAILTAVESRSSSPLRILRGEDFQSLSAKGLFPAGEGAGYAGGIISAAVDGMRIAEAVARHHEEV